MKMSYTVICMFSIILCGALQCGAAPASENDDFEVFQTVDTNLNMQVSELRRKNAQKFGDHDIGEKIRLLKSKKRIKSSGDVEKESSVKLREIKALGGKALPGLIDATKDADAEVRVRVLGAIFDIAQKEGIAIDMLPVFKRSIKDKNEKVRRSAVSQIGNLCVDLKHGGKQKSYLECLAILLDAVNGDDPAIQYIAGEYLFRMGEGEKVPEATRDRLGLGKENVGG